MKSVVIGTAGHIDHGKSALVRALTGTDPDRLKEEKARGITIDLGFAHLESGGMTLAFVDVPGHERFVKNMLAGAGGIDLVLLVVAADESVMPQTREHFQICRLLGVPGGVVALTKADLADADMLELATLEARELVAGSFLAGAPIVPVSSTTGEGLDQLRTALTALAARVRQRDGLGPARLPIDRVFTAKGFGTVTTGTLVSGAIAEEDELELLPAGRRVKVRGLQVHGRRAASADAGNRVALNLGGIEVADLARGDTLASAGVFEPSRRLDVAIDLLEDTKALRHGARVRFHQGTSELLGRVAVAGPRTGPGSAAEVVPGASAYARVRLETPAVVTRGDRFILRAYSPPVTIGGGIVLDPQPPRGAIRTAAGLGRFARIDTADLAALAAFVEERGAAGLSRRALLGRLGLSAAAAEAAVSRLAGAMRATAVAELLVSPRTLVDLGDRLLAAIDAHHAAEPLSEGLPREEARERLFGRAAPAVFERVLEDLTAAGKIVARDRLSRAGRQLSLSPEESRARAALEQVYRDAGLAPPDPAAAAAAAGVDAPVADRILKLLVRHKALVRVDTLLFHADALARVKSDVLALKTAGSAARVDVGAFKQRYGISRKFAIPLLEYLDRERVTRRVGEGRVVL